MKTSATAVGSRLGSPSEDYDTIARIQLSERDNSRYDYRDENGQPGILVPLSPFIGIFLLGFGCGTIATSLFLFFVHK